MSAPDTARRERAEKYAEAKVLSGLLTPQVQYIASDGYRAGSREEAAIKDAEIAIIRKTYEQEIAALKQNDANREALLDSLLRLRNEYILEIAALREAAKDFLCECSLVDKLRQYETWQITPGSMDELRKLVEVEP